jgi:hypothetical protein
MHINFFMELSNIRWLYITWLYMDDVKNNLLLSLVTCKGWTRFPEPNPIKSIKKNWTLGGSGSGHGLNRWTKLGLNGLRQASSDWVFKPNEIQIRPISYPQFSFIIIILTIIIIIYSMHIFFHEFKTFVC